jgi:hypothetical protein
MRRDDPQNRREGEHHPEREQRGEQSLTQRHGPPEAQSFRGPFKAPQPAAPRFTFRFAVGFSLLTRPPTSTDDQDEPYDHCHRERYRRDENPLGSIPRPPRGRLVERNGDRRWL